ncbi:hypothetical protein A4G29_14680 [Mycobacterium kansasii]|nr:hypothetical protein A4G29_14680 [Mycobacterium kansasii]
MIVEEPRLVTVRTIAECRLAVLEKATFLRILRDQPQVNRRVAAQIEALTRFDLASAGRVPSRRLYSGSTVATAAP